MRPPLWKLQFSRVTFVSSIMFQSLMVIQTVHRSICGLCLALSSLSVMICSRLNTNDHFNDPGSHYIHIDTELLWLAVKMDSKSKKKKTKKPPQWLHTVPSPCATQTPRAEPSMPLSQMDGDSWIPTLTNRDSNLPDLLWVSTTSLSGGTENTGNWLGFYIS